MALFGEVSKFFVIGFVLQIIALVIDIVGFASPYWIKGESSIDGIKVEAHGGLWKYCISSDFSGQDVSNCNQVVTNAGWFKAVQAFACLGLICLLIAVVALPIKLRLDKASLLHLSAGLTFAGAICILISIAVFAAKEKESGATGHFHFAFAFCVIAMILAIPAGILIIVG
ncbi:uncharacterized protein LOC133181966 [Saccostrea echinata]|uniref:uncharacterized protein LOC133181966 n=1 Tax=Saccostrea echinata TaxID=191078 RepID=UPI002A82ADE8|nr:uncharacterized protein LOC133181966 [Saccostrea echinata]